MQYMFHSSRLGHCYIVVGYWAVFDAGKQVAHDPNVDHPGTFTRGEITTV